MQGRFNVTWLYQLLEYLLDVEKEVIKLLIKVIAFLQWHPNFFSKFKI